MGSELKKIILSEKLNEIHKVEGNPIISQVGVEMANHLGLGPSSLCKIMSNKNKIIERKIKCGANSKKRMNLGPGAKEQMEKKNVNGMVPIYWSLL
jgi:hypothetical protein